MKSKATFDYYKSHEDGELTRSKYVAVRRSLFLKIRDQLLQGNRVWMPAGYGWMQIVQRDKSFLKAAPNWKESFKLRAQLELEGKELYDKETGKGHKWLVYHTDPYYYKLKWGKGNCNITAANPYMFIPSRSKSGIRTLLLKLQREDPLMETRYQHEDETKMRKP